MSKKKMLTSEPYGSIKPCPFCGWGTIVNGGLLNYRCQCNACGATTKGYPTWEMAIEAWNRRTDDLISRQAAIEEILEYCSSDFTDEYECGYDDGLRKAVHKLKHLPSAQDVVEVVRCKECRFYNEGEMMCNDTNGFDRWWKPDDFCSYGERRTDDANKTD